MYGDNCDTQYIRTCVQHTNTVLWVKIVTGKSLPWVKKWIVVVLNDPNQPLYLQLQLPHTVRLCVHVSWQRCEAKYTVHPIHQVCLQTEHTTLLSTYVSTYVHLRTYVQGILPTHHSTIPCHTPHTHTSHPSLLTHTVHPSLLTCTPRPGGTGDLLAS